MQTWAEFRNELRQAVEAFVDGDAGPYRGCWSDHDDCTLFGAFGGVVHGGAAIAERLEWAASQYRGSRYTRFEVLSDLETPEQAVLVHIEQIQSDDGLTSRERRVTHVARREHVGWRIAHQHSDPLVEVVVR